MYIFDLDGTMDLTDPRLTAKILKMSKNGTIFVTATGRTNNYVRETCKRYGIMPPRFIIADNGGTIYDNVNREYIMRTTLPTETRTRLLSEFMQRGGNPDEIRYTDGDNVFASTSSDVKKYYENETIIEYRDAEELIREGTEEESNITKITLAGSKKLMVQMIEFVKEEGIKCWTDIGATKFPVTSRRNYRVDITYGDISKGRAVEFLSEHTGIQDFTCIGNGPNDFSMFKYALDCGMPVIVVRSNQREESKELIARVEDYARSIEQEDKVTVADFPINKYIDSLDSKKSAKQRRVRFAKEIQAETTPRIDTSKKGGRSFKINSRER